MAASRPVFYYDLGSPYAYLAAERVNRVLPVVPVWQPILLGGVWKATGGGSWSLTEHRAEGMAEVERRAVRYALSRRGRSSHRRRSRLASAAIASKATPNTITPHAIPGETWLSRAPAPPIARGSAKMRTERRRAFADWPPARRPRLLACHTMTQGSPTDVASTMVGRPHSRRAEKPIGGDGDERS